MVEVMTMTGVAVKTATIGEKEMVVTVVMGEWFQFGHCKFQNQCTLQHVVALCEVISCNRDCGLRHLKSLQVLWVESRMKVDKDESTGKEECVGKKRQISMIS